MNERTNPDQFQISIKPEHFSKNVSNDDDVDVMLEQKREPNVIQSSDVIAGHSIFDYEIFDVGGGGDGGGYYLFFIIIIITCHTAKINFNHKQQQQQQLCEENWPEQICHGSNLGKKN
ncbi:hypothetical protein DERP_010912 [Dermatophagoides pteronyssinus]|uniref:Uncharacterized protein n=1 Tax=Dermatophagoides pteronyssinus TaxID=6956 RepID=A0ABQ8JUS8_DERPT|nr:hypothetical protein DERP_010912 [Dermatophagoides pteronyssinus]